jgi:hypothetical protein
LLQPFVEHFLTALAMAAVYVIDQFGIGDCSFNQGSR